MLPGARRSVARRWLYDEAQLGAPHRSPDGPCKPLRERLVTRRVSMRDWRACAIAGCGPPRRGQRARSRRCVNVHVPLRCRRRQRLRSTSTSRSNGSTAVGSRSSVTGAHRDPAPIASRRNLAARCATRSNTCTSREVRWVNGGRVSIKRAPWRPSRPGGLITAQLAPPPVSHQRVNSVTPGIRPAGSAAEFRGAMRLRIDLCLPWQ